MAKRCKSPRGGRQEKPEKSTSWVDELKKKLQERLQSETPKEKEIPTVMSERQKRKEEKEPTGAPWAIYE